MGDLKARDKIERLVDEFEAGCLVGLVDMMMMHSRVREHLVVSSTTSELGEDERQMMPIFVRQPVAPFG